MADTPAAEGDEFSEPCGLMHEPPIIDAFIDTIDDAELARWQYLGTACACKILYHPWRMLRRETRYRRLAEIAARFRCRRCGLRPHRVWLYWRGGRDGKDERELTILETLSDPLPPQRKQSP